MHQRRMKVLGTPFGPHRVHQSTVGDACSGTPDSFRPYPVDRERSVRMVHLGPLCRGESKLRGESGGAFDSTAFL